MGMDLRWGRFRLVRTALGEPTCTNSKEDKVAALAYAKGISFILDPQIRNVRQIAVRATFGCRRVYRGFFANLTMPG